MPSVRIITKNADGFSVTRSSGAVVSLTRSMIPTAQRNDPAQVKTFVENWIVQQGWRGICRVNSVNPLDVSLLLSDKAMDLPANIFDMLDAARPRGVS